MNPCLICSRITAIKNGCNPYFVMELKSGYVVLGDFQCYKGYTLFLSKKHTSELHELPEEEKILFLKEMSIVAEAVFNTLQPSKINYELLGNKDRHCHWHIIPRYQNDPSPFEPIWHIPKNIRCSEEYKAENQDLFNLKLMLKNAIINLLR